MTRRLKNRLLTIFGVLALSLLISVSVVIFANAATANFALNGNYAADYGENEEIDILAADIEWNGSRVSSYGVMIEKDGKIVDTFSEVTGKFGYTLGRCGIYTVKYFVSGAEGIYTNHFKFEVKKRLILSRAAFPAMIATGRKTELPTVYARYDGQQWRAEVEVIAPDQSRVEVTDHSFVPEALGKYEIRYAYTVGGETVRAHYTVECAVTPSSLFGTLDDYTTLEDNVDLPAYSVPGNGVRVLGIGSSSGIYTENLIDLNELGAEDNLFALQTYVEGDVLPFRQMNVTIEDSLNPKNTILLKYERVSRFSPNSRISVNYNGNWYGMCNESYKDNFYNKLWVNRFGTLLNKSSFYPDSNINNGLFALRFDYATKQIWALSDHGEYSLVMDLDDSEQLLETGAPLGEEQIWQGFSSSKVKLTIGFEYVENKAGIILTEIAGQKLSGNSVQDGTPPVISVTKPEKTPVAVVGRPYPLFAAEALDVVCGECAVKTIVTDSQGRSVRVENNAFTPTETGTYTVEYRAQDRFGHSSSVSYGIDSCTEREYTEDPIKLEFVSEPERAFVGAEEQYRIPEVVISGGAGGWYSAEYEYRYGTEIFQPNEQRKIRLNQKKNIVITAKIRDYLGTETVKTLTIRVYSPPTVVMDVDGVPDAVETGEIFHLPEFRVTDYFDSAVPAMELTVNGVPIDLAKMEYLVTEKAGETLTLRYAGGSGERRVEKVYEVRVIELTDTFREFFLTDGTSQLGEEGMRFESETPMRLQMPYPIADNDILIRANVLSNRNGFDRFAVVLTDYRDASCRIRLNICKELLGGVPTGKVYLTVNGDSRRYPFAGSFTDDTKEIFLNVAPDGTILDSLGQKVTKIGYCENGDLFAGFPSHRVRVGIDTESVSETFRSSGFLLKQVSNQTFSSWIEGDIYPPKINVLGTLVSGTIQKGEKITVPPAICCDVLSAGAKVRVQVYGPNRKLLLEGDCTGAISFTASEYGEYVVRYIAEDIHGLREEHEVNLYVADEEAPEITVDGTVARTLKCGESLIVPTAAAKDNLTKELTVHIALQDSGGRYQSLEAGEKVVFSKAGRYRLIYFCFDEDYNLARSVYEIEVTGK